MTLVSPPSGLRNSANTYVRTGLDKSLPCQPVQVELQSILQANEAGELFGAINELRNNVAEHSENPRSGYLAYDAIQDQFEFVVADSGIGILKSLRTHPHYSHVTDSGTALNLALSEGVSRHHSDKDRGLGFRPIFVGLANASEHLRFCSGDHTREFTRGVDRRVISSTRQKAPLSGFFCSVRCAPHNR
jgi:hypothetical protein